MPPSIRIAIRFLLSKKRSMIMSLCGIAFGVGFFIVTQAQLSGFERMLIETIIGTDGAIRIEDKFQSTLVSFTPADRKDSNFAVVERNSRRYVEGVEHPRKVIETIQELSNVAATSAVLKGGVNLESSLRKDSAQLYGINIDDHIAVSEIEEQIVSGTLEDFQQTPTGVLLGLKKANRLQVTVGDSIVIQARGVSRRYRISAIYQTGVSDIDKVRVFMHMSEARSLLQKPSGVSFVQVSLFDNDRAPFDSLQIEQMTQHSATSWQHRERSWLNVFKALGVSAAITVSTIIFISGLGMFNTLVMIVMEKTREIAILRSMGYTRQDISSIFLLQGGIVLVFGTLVGFLIGAAVTYGISNMYIGITGEFTADYFPVRWAAVHYVYAAIIATLIVLFASLLPARRAAKLIPGDVIRGTSG